MKENLMLISYDYALARRLAGSLSDFLEMRFFDMFDMFVFNNAPHTLTDVLKTNGRDYAIKEMRGVLKTELEFSGAVFVVEPKMLGLNQDLFEEFRNCNLVVFLKRDYKAEYVTRERMIFKSADDKEFFRLQLDELSENAMNIENNLADIVIDINNLNFEQIKEKIKKALEDYVG